MADIKKPEGDERLKNDRESHVREREDANIGQRANDQRAQDMQMTDPERRRVLRDKWTASVLPDLPARAGWHRCWVSSTHTIDTPARRAALGYSFVKLDDVKAAGWSADTQAVKDGQFNGGVMWREMVAMEIPQDEFNDYMREFHHDQPTEQANGIFETLDGMNADAKRVGGRVTLEQGLEEMRRRMQTPPPRQFET